MGKHEARFHHGVHQATTSLGKEPLNGLSFQRGEGEGFESLTFGRQAIQVTRGAGLEIS